MCLAAPVQIVSMVTLAGENGRWELRGKSYLFLLYTFRLFSLICDLTKFGNKSESFLALPPITQSLLLP